MAKKMYQSIQYEWSPNYFIYVSWLRCRRNTYKRIFDDLLNLKLKHELIIDEALKGKNADTTFSINMEDKDSIELSIEIYMDGSGSMILNILMAGSFILEFSSRKTLINTIFIPQ